MQSWKSFTAKQANKLLGRTGRFWQPEYFDRMIRNEGHLAAAVNYIHGNPLKAELVVRAEDWPSSSAGMYSEQPRAGETPALWAPRFQQIIEESRARGRAEGAISTEEMRRRLGLKAKS